MSLFNDQSPLIIHHSSFYVKSSIINHRSKSCFINPWRVIIQTSSFIDRSSLDQSNHHRSSNIHTLIISINRLIIPLDSMSQSSLNHSISCHHHSFFHSLFDNQSSSSIIRCHVIIQSSIDVFSSFINPIHVLIIIHPLLDHPNQPINHSMLCHHHLITQCHVINDRHHLTINHHSMMCHHFGHLSIIRCFVICHLTFDVMWSFINQCLVITYQSINPVIANHPASIIWPLIIQSSSHPSFNISSFITRHSMSSHHLSDEAVKLKLRNVQRQCLE